MILRRMVSAGEIGRHSAGLKLNHAAFLTPAAACPLFCTRGGLIAGNRVV